MTPPVRAVVLCFLVFLLATALPGCSEETGGAGGNSLARAPTIIDEDTMLRLLAALQEVRSVSNEQVEESAREAQTEGRTLTPMAIASLSMIENPLPILRRHGFSSEAVFEGKLNYARMALQRVMLDEYGGFGGKGRMFQINGAISDAQTELRTVQEDQTLSREQKGLRETELRLRLEQLQEELDGAERIAAAMKSQFDNIPAESLEVVARYQNEFIALLGR